MSQPDRGFRKTKILNEATRVAQGDLLVFIDGDCIPHRHFVRQHRRLARPKTALAGRRVNLGPKLTGTLVQTRQLATLSLPHLLFSDAHRVEEAIYFSRLPSSFDRPRGLLGCNWSIHRSDLLAINGHDEDYQRASVGEDSDIEWRLSKLGIQTASVKFRAIVYHLYHASNYHQQDIDFNINLMKEKQQRGLAFCENGII